MESLVSLPESPMEELEPHIGQQWTMALCHQSEEVRALMEAKVEGVVCCGGSRWHGDEGQGIGKSQVRQDKSIKDLRPCSFPLDLA